jgi:hypothetical protein
MELIVIRLLFVYISVVVQSLYTSLSLSFVIRESEVKVCVKNIYKTRNISS